MEKIKKEQIVFNIVFILLLVTFLILPNIFFQKILLINQHNLSDQISLGAFLIGIASAIISSLTVHMQRQYDRVNLNINILFDDLTTPQKWQRWPFVPRSKTRKLLSGEVHRITLDNPKIPFDLGTHEINIYIPTCWLDFFDLPAFSSFFQMFLNNKRFYSYVQRKNISGIQNENILKKDITGSMLWDCIYDIWKNIVLYRIEDMIIYLLTAFIISCVINSIFFSQIIQLGFVL